MSFFCFRKLSINRVHTQVECEESQITLDHGILMNTSRKVSRVGKDENPEERKTSVEDDDAGNVTEDTNIEMSEVDKNDTEKVESPQVAAEQGIT